MGIIRVAKNSNYVVMNRTALNDERLSWKAKGIMAYMLSMPDDWVFYMDELTSHSTDGKASFRAGFNELKKCGYIERKPVREGQRIKEWETIVHEMPKNPLFTDFQEVENQEVENQDVGFQEVENQPLLSTDNNQVLNIPNTDNNQVLTNNKQQVVGSPLRDPEFSKLANFYETNIGALLPVISQELGELYDEYKDVELIIEAFKLAVQTNARNKTRYATGILRNWKSELITTYEQLKTKEVREQNAKHKSSAKGERTTLNTLGHDVGF